MFVNRVLFQQLLDNNRWLQEKLEQSRIQCHGLVVENNVVHSQKAKDDITIDWMRHRINALEKERTVLLQKVAGINLPTPEIEIAPARQAVADLNWDHGFEDVGDEEAARLGIQHNDLGEVVYQQEKIA